MTATINDRPTARRYVERTCCEDALVAAQVTIPNGVMVCTTANGELVNAADLVGLTMQGRAARRMTNLSGASARVNPKALVEAGVFKWANVGGANAVTAADLGKSVFIVDNQTVGKVAAAPVAGNVAGTLESIDPDGGVWVRSNT
jgi:hypothetical protein